jgi:hypothetical protein
MFRITSSIQFTAIILFPLLVLYAFGECGLIGNSKVSMREGASQINNFVKGWDDNIHYVIQWQ